MKVSLITENSFLLSKEIKIQHCDIASGAIISCESPVGVFNTKVLGSLSLGRFSYVGAGSILGGCKIGRFCSIAPNVTIGLGQHPSDWISTHPFQFNKNQFSGNKEYVEASLFEDRSANTIRTIPVIGNDVWVGTGVIILRGVTIGHGAIIAANSVVTKDVPPYAVVAGSPASIIKYRIPEDVSRKLLELKWWDYDLRSFKGISFSDIYAAVCEIESRISSDLVVEADSYVYTVVR